jgi:hypothetical protein
MFELCRQQQDGQVSAGAFRNGAHDDLVVALALACIGDPAQYTVSYGPEIFASGPPLGSDRASAAAVRRIVYGMVTESEVSPFWAGS